jgi:hypothetical protein
MCDENNEPMMLDAFGYKAIASRKDIFETVEDRSVQIVMPKSRKRYPKLTKQEAEEIRAKLSQYRIDCLAKKQPLKYEVVTSELRLADVMQPLLAVTPEKHRPILENIVKEEEELRRDRNEEKLDYKVLVAFSNAVAKLPPGEKTVSTEQVAAELPFEKMSPITVGRVLGRLGFEKTQVPTYDPKTNKRTTKRHWIINQQKIDELSEERDLKPVADESDVSDTGSSSIDDYTHAEPAPASATSDTSDIAPAK